MRKSIIPLIILTLFVTGCTGKPAIVGMGAYFTFWGLGFAHATVYEYEQEQEGYIDGKVIAQLRDAEFELIRQYNLSQDRSSSYRYGLLKGYVEHRKERGLYRSAEP